MLTHGYINVYGQACKHAYMCVRMSAHMLVCMYVHACVGTLVCEGKSRTPTVAFLCMLFALDCSVSHLGLTN